MLFYENKLCIPGEKAVFKIVNRLYIHHVHLHNFINLGLVMCSEHFINKVKYIEMYFNRKL